MLVRKMVSIQISGAGNELPRANRCYGRTSQPEPDCLRRKTRSLKVIPEFNRTTLIIILACKENFYLYQDKIYYFDIPLWY
jgi:hypothetical protein